MQITVDTRGLVNLEKGLKALSKRQMNRAVYRSTNATGGTARTLMMRTVAKETSLTVTYVRGKVGVSKAGANKPDYHLKIKDHHIRLIEFKGRQLKGRTRAKVWGKTQTFKNTFITTLKNGTQGIFKHQKGRTSTGNQKIEMLYGSALPKEIMRGSSTAKVNAHVQAKFPANIKRFTAREMQLIKTRYKL